MGSGALRSRWTRALVGLAVVGAVWTATGLLRSAQAQARVEPTTCPNCEAAAGPITIDSLLQKVRLNVHNIDPNEALVTMAFIDAMTGRVLSRSQKVLDPFMGTFFDLDLGQRELPAMMQIIGGVRVSRMKGTPGGSFGATLEVMDAEGKTGFVLQFPPGQQRGGWGWEVESKANQW